MEPEPTKREFSARKDVGWRISIVDDDYEPITMHIDTGMLVAKYLWFAAWMRFDGLRVDEAASLAGATIDRLIADEHSGVVPQEVGRYVRFAVLAIDALHRFRQWCADAHLGLIRVEILTERVTSW